MCSICVQTIMSPRSSKTRDMPKQKQLLPPNQLPRLQSLRSCDDSFVRPHFLTIPLCRRQPTLWHPVVNFNILHAHFLYESAQRSFSLVTFWQKKRFHTKKHACKMLMKLTPRRFQKNEVQAGPFVPDVKKRKYLQCVQC